MGRLAKLRLLAGSRELSLLRLLARIAYKLLFSPRDPTPPKHWGVASTIGPNVLVLGDTHVGRHCRVNFGSTLSARRSISLGDHVIIGEYVLIRDHSEGKDAAPVTIEDDVWIGRGAVIEKGVRIGRGSVIGANAVVESDIPPLSVAVGRPARIIKRRGG